MFEVQVLNIENSVVFIKKFNDSFNAYKFVRKVNYSKKLKLLGVINYSYMFD